MKKKEGLKQKNSQNICRYKKYWKSNAKRIEESTYDYHIFENCMCISIIRNSETICQYKCCNNDIQQLRQSAKWLFLQICGQTFIIRKKDLQDDTA